MTKLIISILAIVVAIIISFFYWITHRYSVIDKTKSTNFYFNFFKSEIHYIPMGNWFELGDVNLTDLNVKQFQILSEKFIKDDKCVYFEGVKITNADPSTFVVLEGNYHEFAKDKHALYYRCNSFENIDLSTYEIVFDKRQVKDKNNVYSLDYNEGYNNSVIIKPLLKNYVDFTEGYGKVDSTLCFKGVPIKGSSSNQFLLIYKNNTFAKTQSGLYVQGFPVDNFDIASFSDIPNSNYFKDKNGIYSGAEELFYKKYDKEKGYDVVNTIGYKAKKLEIDMATFQVFEGSDYVKDKNGIYFVVNDEAKKIKDADIASFEVLKNKMYNLAKDKHHTYLHGEVYDK